jgi:hypothetical protein
MKKYPSDKVYKACWLTGKKYVHCSNVLMGGVTDQLYDVVEKYPIAKIKHDKEKYPNPVDIREVFDICYNFHPFAFEPIVISRSDELKDGQHRLEVAKWFGWEFIDVFVEKDDYTLLK